MTWKEMQMKVVKAYLRENKQGLFGETFKELLKEKRVESSVVPGSLFQGSIDPFQN